MLLDEFGIALQDELGASLLEESYSAAQLPAPLVLVQPQPQSVAAGAVATFSALISGVPTPTLQWYRNGVAISGATSGVYTFTAALADNGAAFFCRGTNAAGAVNTIAVMLTVTSASPAVLSAAPAKRRISTRRRA